MTASFKAVMIGGVRWYQQHISANTPPCCKYYPTCSNYAIEALERYGAFKGGVLAVLRYCVAGRGVVGESTMFHNGIPFFTGFRGRRLMKSLD